jgi:N-methylhydantoinase B
VSRQSIDAVSLGIMWDRLIAIADNILSSIVRTAFSLTVRESWDLACVIFDADGRALAQATFAMPAFIGTAPMTMKHMLTRYPAHTLHPGDVLVTNDPWLGTGHTPDICVARPVFHETRLVGFIMTITHLPDIGGAGLLIDNADVFHEGLLVPVCKLYEKGEPNRAVHDIITQNVRVVDEVLGDIHSNLTGTSVGERLIGEFMQEYELADLQSLADAILGQSELALRRELQAIPDGTYQNEIEIESVRDAIKLACELTIAEDGASIDFAGSDPVQPAAINVPLCYTRSFATYALKCVTVPGIPNNEGILRPIDVTAPEGSILNALKPAPTGGRHMVGWFVVPLIMGALADRLPGRVQADSGMVTLIPLSGRRADGRDIAGVYYLAGGLGAMDGKDGRHAIPFPTNNAVVSTEVWGRETGMRVRYRRLIPDTGGAGRYRGGVSQEIVLENDNDTALSISIFGLRTDFPARGFQGGGEGAPRYFLINDQPVPPKGHYELAPGDRLLIREAGGGGFGDPTGRDLKAVVTDVADGLVTVAGAARDYGIVIDESGHASRRA